MRIFLGLDCEFSVVVFLGWLLLVWVVGNKNSIKLLMSRQSFMTQ